MSLDAIITAKREAEGLTAAQAAKKAGLTYETYKGIESGDIMPNTEELLDIAMALSTSLTRFLDYPKDAAITVREMEVLYVSNKEYGRDTAELIRNICHHTDPLLKTMPRQKIHPGTKQQAVQTQKKNTNMQQSKDAPQKPGDHSLQSCHEYLSGLNADGLKEAAHLLGLLCKVPEYQK